jgi:hypothetical protein
MFHVGNDRSELDMEDVDVRTQGKLSTLGTGGGTDHDDGSIRARPEYRWEGLLNSPSHKSQQSLARFFSKMGVWMGMNPFWNSDNSSAWLALDVRLEKGKYILIEGSNDIA